MRPCLLPFLSSVFSLILFQAHAQAPLPGANGWPVLNTSVQLLNTENGLPQGYVNGIVQDSIGFIWLSTKDGLARYDGHEVKVFRYDAANPASIAPGIIQTIYPDRENHIWILYVNNEVDIFDPVTGKAKHIMHDSKLGWLTNDRHDTPFTLFEDSHHRYWIVSSDLKNLQQFTLKHPQPINIPVPAGEIIIALQEDTQGQIWVCTDQALYKIKDNHFNKIANLPEQPPYTRPYISQMIQDKTGDWLIRDKGCIEIWKPDGKWQIIKIPPAKNITHGYFMCLAKDDHIYFNSAGCIYRLNKNHTLSLIWTNPNYPKDIMSMLADRSNTLWVGMNTFGVAQINLTSTGFHSYTYQYGFIMDVLTRWFQIPFPEKSRQQVDSYFPRHAYDQQGRLWFIKIPPLSSSLMYKKNNLSIFEVARNKYNVTSFQYHSNDWSQIVFDDKNNCWGIVLDSSGTHCQLVKANIVTGNMQLVLPLSYPYYNIGYLTAFDHKLCITYHNGIQIYDPQSGKSTFYRSKNTFGNTTLLMTTSDPHNNTILWIATMGNGLIKFNTLTQKSQAYTEKEGIPSNTVYAALADRHDYFWCSSNKGIFRFDPVTDSVLSFTVKDGLQGNEFNRYHFLKTPDGHFIFGGTQGWTVFDPDSIHIDHYQPPAVITNILVNNKPLQEMPRWKDSAVTSLRALKLKYDQNFITFTYAGLEFNNPTELRYRYKLQGFDDKWINVKSQQTANYTNLPPGHYLFEINASNTAGKWSPDIKTLQVIILPPWWKTWWAYILYAIILFTAGYIFYRYRMERLYTKHAIILKEKEVKQLKELDEIKSRFFSNVTHEFRTPLSLIIAPLEQINKEEASSDLKKKLSAIQRNAKQLLRLINQLLDLSKVEAGNMKIYLSRGDLGSLIADNINLFNQQAAAKRIQLHFENTIHEEYLFDADKWQKILSNLLSNAIKFTPEGGNIYIHLAATNDNERSSTISLIVKDTGTGIAKDKLPFIFNRFFQADSPLTRVQGGTGIGLALAKELTKLMGGTIEAESEPGKGSQFTVSIPVQKATDENTPGTQKITADIPASFGQEQEEEKSMVGKEAPLVLIVEDNKELNHFIKQTLAKSYNIITAYNGQEGLEMANENVPDVIISDIMMPPPPDQPEGPEMDGLALCKAIKQSITTNHIAFILLSAKSSHENIIKGLENYADDYIVKPFHPDELLLRIHNLIDRQHKLKDHYYKQLTSPEEKINPAFVTDPFLQQVCQIIEDELDNVELDVEWLAKKMAMSRKTLSRKLEMLSSLSAGKMIKQYRLKKAAELLRSGHNVSETAYSTGFETPSYFSLSFKEFYGVSPSKYMKAP